MADPLLITVKRCLQRYRFFTDEAPLVVAVSTGVDSMVLLTLLEQLLAPQQVVVAHVNHRLREQSNQEEAFLRQYCEQRQLKLMVDQWEQHPSHGIEDAARHERYEFFARVMREVGATTLLTAHHENDVAETLLMKLVRSGEPTEVVGLTEQHQFADGQIIRPLLHVTKDQLVDYGQQHHVKWFEDQTNQEDATLRNRFRHHYLPALIKENPQLLDHLSYFHDELAGLITLRDEQTNQQLDKVSKGHALETAAYQQLSNYLRPWVLREWLNREQVFDIGRQQLGQLDQWLMNSQKPTGQELLTNDQVLIKNYSQIRVEKVQNLPTKNEKTTDFMVEFDHWYTNAEGNQFGIFRQPRGQVVAEVWLTPGQLPLKVRDWQADDLLRLRNGDHQKVRRILIDQKVPQSLRNQQLVVVDQAGQVLWVVNQKTAWLDRDQLCDQNYQISYFCQKRHGRE